MLEKTRSRLEQMGLKKKKRRRFHPLAGVREIGGYRKCNDYTLQCRSPRKRERQAAVAVHQDFWIERSVSYAIHLAHTYQDGWVAGAGYGG
ncbi:MAG: hypothetical protein ACRDHW_13460, partial [Ktedonobacteraceae bacterium]